MTSNTSNISKLPLEQSFASHPKAKFWSIKNSVKPEDVKLNSSKKYVFDCECGHEIEKKVRDIVGDNSWCSYCCYPPIKLCDNKDCIKCFNKSFASSFKAQCWSDKNNIKPNEIFLNANKKYLFNCECGHEIEKSPNKITTTWCSYCANKLLCNKDDCIMCFNKSFASYEKAIYWSKKNVETPRQVFKSANFKYGFDCPCGHYFESSLNFISKGSWCSYCNINTMKLCENTECNMCFKRSFASSDKAKFWSSNNNLTPRQVAKGSDKKFEFICECKHSFSSALYSITGGDNWCAFCTNQRLCNKDECIQCYDKSFASSKYVKFFSDDNKINPRTIFKKSPKKYLFNCNKCTQKFNSSLNHISQGKWCPFCKHKTEHKLFDEMIIYYPTLLKQCRFEWCKNLETNRFLPFDLIIPEYKIIIELDGIQHFKQVSNWNSPEDTHLRDIYKMKCSNDNGYSMIRILQDDVCFNKFKWLEELKTSIEKIKLEKKVQNIFLCKNDEYKIFN